MTKSLWKPLLTSFAVLGPMLVVARGAIAKETTPDPTQNISPTENSAATSPDPNVKKVTIQGDDTLHQQLLFPTSGSPKFIAQDPEFSSHTPAKISPENKIAQVTSVSQLSDVQPTDWAFAALQSLVERYGCIAGYPNSTYRGDRAMTRYEFAAGLNACLERINELIGTATTDLVSKEDLATLQRLQSEFAAELVTLRGRVDTLEARNAELEANQFSTTTKLTGEVVLGLTSVLSGNDDNNTTVGARLHLDLLSSFTGEDELKIRIAANNIVSPEIDTREGRLGFASEDGESSTDASIETIFYSFPVGESTRIGVYANGSDADDITDTVNILDGDGGEGALSAFGTRNPIYSPLEDGAGLVVRQEFGKSLELSLAYLASEANNPSEGNGLFNGPYGALAQVTFKPSDRLTLGLTYINSYNRELESGSNRANPQSFLSDALDVEVPFSSNSYGAELSWRLSDKFVLGGWLGYTNARNLSTAEETVNRGKVDIWNWAVTLGFPDLGKPGNLGGIIVGMEPKVTSSSINEIDKDEDTSYHIEVFYQYRVTDNIAITPGIIWLTAPDHNNNNDGVVIGTVRTTFSF
jgi:Carbohydrate-selective porin, OprB family/S-layer homology domain